MLVVRLNLPRRFPVKVSGLAIYTVNNSVDPSVKVVLRGYRSLTGNNEARLLLMVCKPLPLYLPCLIK